MRDTQKLVRSQILGPSGVEGQLKSEHQNKRARKIRSGIKRIGNIKLRLQEAYGYS